MFLQGTDAQAGELAAREARFPTGVRHETSRLLRRDQDQASIMDMGLPAGSCHRRASVVCRMDRIADLDLTSTSIGQGAIHSPNELTCNWVGHDRFRVDSFSILLHSMYHSTRTKH